MELTKAERWILINQCEMLRLMKSDRWQKEDWDKCISILEKGYEELYDECMPWLSDPLLHDVYKLVYDILDVYRSIGRYKSEHPEDKEVAEHYASSFRGFDGNNEGEYMGFTTFLIKMGRYKEIADADHGDNYNSHCPMVPKYRNMASIWNTTEHELGVLTKEQVMQLLAAPNSSSVPEQP